MENNYTYKDINNRQVYPRFKLSGFQNDILTCTLYKKRNMPSWIPFKKSKIHYKEIAFTVATDNLETIAKYTPEDYHNLVLETLEKYNKELGLKDYVNNQINSLNNLVL
jgi:hypothetical protein